MAVVYNAKIKLSLSLECLVYLLHLQSSRLLTALLTYSF